MKNSIKQLVLALLCLNSLLAIAQQGDTLEIQRNEKGKITFARFKPEANRKIADGENFLKTFLDAGPADELRLKKETIDQLGITHIRYQQYYQGIKVENAEYLLHGKDGLIETINGDFQDVGISSVKPSITEQQALDSALNFVGAQKYKWEDAEMEQLVKQNTNNPKATYYPEGELVIVRDALKDNGKLKLAWKFTIHPRFLIMNNGFMWMRSRVKWLEQPL